MRRVVLALAVLFASGGAFALERSAERPAPLAATQQLAEDSRLDLQTPEDDAPKTGDSWWQKILRDAPHCKSFTDGCRTCSQTVCSNIGIACQPKDWSCNDTTPDAKPEMKPETKPDEKPEPKQ